MMIGKKELNAELTKEFDLICFEDLGDLLEKSPAGIYRCLERNRRDKYESKDRLVLYSRVAITNAVIEHINYGLEMFDIEPFFLELLSEVKEISGPIKFQHRSLSVIDGNDWSGDCAPLSCLCPMPWTSIQISNQGKIRPCCVFDGSLGNIGQEKIQDVFDSKGYQKIRSELLSGKIPAGCQNCFKEESYNQISNRQRSLTTFQKEFLLDTVEDPKIMNLDIRGGITCNMKCRICDEHSSSLWAAENKKFSITKIEASDWIKQKQNWDQLVKLLPQCVNIDFFGGEPLLNKQILDLFEKAQELDVAKNIRLNINTNGSVWNPNFVDFFPTFKSVNIGISIDDIQERFELQRGSSWATVESNVKKFLSMNDQKFHAYIYTTLNIQNVYYLPELLDWAQQQGASVMFSNLNFPQYFDIDRMTPAAKEIVAKKLSSADDPRLKDIAIRIANSPGSDGSKFVAFMNDLDQKRQQDFSLAHREIAIAMGYHV